ncbi:hypothetical protein FD754_008780, partial [Muntiacus muntjak]
KPGGLGAPPPRPPRGCGGRSGAWLPWLPGSGAGGARDASHGWSLLPLCASLPPFFF